MSDEMKPSHIHNTALDHLNLCLKTARMGVWEAVLLKNPSVPSEIKWDCEVRQMHGVPENQEVVPLDWFFKHVHPDDNKPLAEAYQRFFIPNSIKGPISFTYRIVWPNGEVHYIQMHASIAPQASTESQVKVYGIAKDITQEVLKQKVIDDQKNRLLSTSRMAVLGEISGGIAHEINNPLTVIQARSFQLLQMAENNNLDAAKIKSAAESISKTGDKIAKIVKSLRAFAQGQENEPVDTINVRELVQETLDFCKVRFYNHGIDIRIGDIPEHLDFECRLIQIEEALLNIFNNAHDAVATMGEKWILIEAFDKEPMIEIHVTDSGPGIPDRIADKMMLPFFTTKEIGKGMGLGLSIVAEILAKHHGVIFLDRTSVNTKFVIRLPKHQPQ